MIIVCNGKEGFCHQNIRFGTKKNRLSETILLSTKTYAKMMGKEIITILCSNKFHIWTYAFTFCWIRSLSEINSAFPLPASATLFIRVVDTPFPIPNVNTLKIKQVKTEVKNNNLTHQS